MHRTEWPLTASLPGTANRCAPPPGSIECYCAPSPGYCPAIFRRVCSRPGICNMPPVLRTLLFAIVSFSPWIASAVDIGSPVGAVKLTTWSGAPLEMNNYGERPATAMLFLSARCEATRKATADINQIYRKFRLRNVLFVGVFPDPAETLDEVRTFSQRCGMIYPTYRDPAGTVARQFGARVTPEIYLLDRQGVLVYHGDLHDAAARTAFDSAINNLLRKQPIEKFSQPLAGTPLDKPGAAGEIADPYGTISFSSELIFEKIPHVAAVHCSTICEAANHDLLSLWYGGSYESADDQTLFLARKKPGDRNWGAPQALLQNPSQPPGNGVIFRDGSDRLWIVWCRMEGSRPTRRGSGWDRCRLFARTSTDHGVTWSDDKQVLADTVWCVPRNPPVMLKSGTLLLPVEGLQGDVEGSHFLTLARGASDWKLAGFTAGGSQPAVVERTDGSLLALLRHARMITQITSADAGRTWSQAEPTTLANPDSGITMVKLANGHLLTVYNDSQTRRTPLSIVRSRDEGKTWEKPLHLESNPGEYSYPCIIQASDGKIHVTYTFRRYSIKHVELNEDWFDHEERPD